MVEYAEVNGGEFGASFASSFTASFAMSAMQLGGVGKNIMGYTEGGGASAEPQYVFSRTVTAALIGGTAEEIGGGKFANGAVTAALQHLFNAEAEIGKAAAEAEAQQQKTFDELAAQSKNPIAIVEKQWVEDGENNHLLVEKLQERFGQDRVIVASNIKEAVQQIDSAGLTVDAVFIFSHVNPNGVTMPRLFHVFRTKHWTKELGRVTNNAWVCGVNCGFSDVSNINKWAGWTGSTWWASNVTIVPQLHKNTGALKFVEEGTSNERIFSSYSP